MCKSTLRCHLWGLQLAILFGLQAIRGLHVCLQSWNELQMKLVKNKKEIFLNATVKVMLPGQGLCLRRMVLVGFFFSLQNFSSLKPKSDEEYLLWAN